MKLNELRQLHKVTQEQMAQRLGISRPGVQKVERGCDTTTKTLRGYAEHLGIPFELVASAWETSYSKKNNAHPQ